MPNPNRSLFKVYVVDPRKAGKVLLEKTVIAVSEAEAQAKAGVGETTTKEGLDFDQVDIYCEKVAEFIRPRKDTQKVVIAKTEDADE